MAFAIAAILTGIGAANAGNVRLAWDPPFGPAYPNLGFAGVAEMQYPDACLSVNNTVVDPATDPCNAGSPPDEIAFTSVFLDLYDLIADPTMSLTPAQHLDFIGSTTSSTIQNIIVGGNRIIGVNTFIFGPETTDGPADGLPSGEDVWLQFQTSFSFVIGCEFNCLEVGDPTAFMFVRPPSGYEGPTELCPDGDGNTTCVRSVGAHIDITTVPEPGSMALLIAAMGAALFGFSGARKNLAS
jgi:hypothetical protein